MFCRKLSHSVELLIGEFLFDAEAFHILNSWCRKGPRPPGGQDRWTAKILMKLKNCNKRDLHVRIEKGIMIFLRSNSSTWNLRHDLYRLVKSKGSMTPSQWVAENLVPVW